MKGTAKDIRTVLQTVADAGYTNEQVAVAFGAAGYVPASGRGQPGATQEQGHADGRDAARELREIARMLREADWRWPMEVEGSHDGYTLLLAVRAEVSFLLEELEASNARERLKGVGRI